MSEQYTISQAITVSATHALKTLKPIAWESLSYAYAEANKAGSVLIAPTDILAGILLNTGAVAAHHTLRQLGIERTDETMNALRSNRTVPSSMQEILLSNLYGNYRRLTEQAVSRAKDILLQELELLQDETIPNAEALADSAVNSLTKCGMDSDDAINAVRELRESILAELNAINATFEKTTSLIDERSKSITGPSSMLSAWILNAKKGIYPHIKTDDVGNIFSKASLNICCLARKSTNKPLIDNEHLLLGMTADSDGPGHAALQALSIDPSALRWLIRNSTTAA